MESWTAVDSTPLNVAAWPDPTAPAVRCTSAPNPAPWPAPATTSSPVAAAGQVIRHGTARMGVCQAAPCNCVYIDRSRARTRRYCCDQCNDRAAIAAYRRRQAGRRA
jgi:predicted RNA-binding Zn ribbon-like protein